MAPPASKKLKTMPIEQYSDSEEDEWEAERTAGPSRAVAPAQQDSEEEEGGVAQFEDDEDEEENYDTSEDEDDETTLRKEISTIPFTSLLKAQKKLSRKRAAASSSSEDDDSDQDGPSTSKRKVSVAAGEERAPRQEKRKNGSLRKVDRASKHAPMEMSSKKAVGRKRIVVDVVGKKEARDPRFDSLSGSFKPDLFAKSYSFLSAAQTSELETLRKTAKAARKNPVLGEEEKAKIESALVRMESREVQRKRKEREGEALREWKKDEEKKREAGKGDFYLKKADKKQVLLKAKYEALSQDKKQLRKSVEKKRKKMAQKDKKLIPRERLGGH